MTFQNTELFPRLLKCCMDSGKAILDWYYHPDEIEFSRKEDLSPLTEADKQSHQIIVSCLLSLNNGFGLDIPVLSEESAEISFSDRKDWTSFWCVDPLDGTKEFIKKNEDFTVNIALVKNGVPVMGFIYQPVADICYFGCEEAGVRKITGLSETDPDTWRQTSVRLQPELSDIPVSIAVIASRSHQSEKNLSFIRSLKDIFSDVTTASRGSSLKFCMLLDSRAHIYPRLAPTMEWDTAAGDALCRAAGLTVIDWNTREPLEYNKEDLLNPFFLAAPPLLLKKIINLVS
jgi:3'(2'), 5'-bisphosphate nucleotidase